VSDTHQAPDGTARPGGPLSKQEAILRAAQINPQIAALLDGASLDAISDHEFRVLSVMGERKGIRLEAVFWKALARIAADLRVPRNTLVLWIMTAAGRDRQNVTSVLRSVAVAYLLADIDRLKTPPPAGK